MKKWLYLVGAIVLEVSGSLSLKAAMDAPAFYAIVVVGYLGAFIGLFASLRHGMNLAWGTESGVPPGWRPRPCCPW